MSYAPVKVAAEMLAKKSGGVSAANRGKEQLDSNSSVERATAKREKTAKKGRGGHEIIAKEVEKCRKSTFRGENLLSKKKIKITHVTEGLMGCKRTQITNMKAKEVDIQTHPLRRSARLITRLEHT
jgi:hypothetical protein